MDDSLFVELSGASGHLAAKGKHRRSHSAPMGPPVTASSPNPLSQQNSASG